MSEQNPRERKKHSNIYLKYSGLAFQLLAAMIVFGWLGHKLDQYMQFHFPVCMLLFGLMAFGGMMYQVYQSLNRP